MLKSLLEFFASPLGKITMALVVVGFIWAAWGDYNRGIAMQERMRNENTQLIQVVQDMQELQTKMTALESANRTILEELATNNNRVIERHSEVRTYLDRSDTRAEDRPASNPIRNTIRILRNEE